MPGVYAWEAKVPHREMGSIRSVHEVDDVVYDVLRDDSSTAFSFIPKEDDWRCRWFGARWRGV